MKMLWKVAERIKNHWINTFAWKISVLAIYLESMFIYSSITSRLINESILAISWYYVVFRTIFVINRNDSTFLLLCTVKFSPYLYHKKTSGKKKKGKKTAYNITRKARCKRRISRSLKLIDDDRALYHWPANCEQMEKKGRKRLQTTFPHGCPERRQWPSWQRRVDKRPLRSFALATKCGKKGPITLTGPKCCDIT